MFLHNSFKCDSGTSGMGVFTIHADGSGLSDPRFDWIKINSMTQDLVPVHLCALLELSSPTESLLLYVGFEGKYVNPEKRQIAPPFPVYRYERVYNNRNQPIPKILIGTIDSINEPAFAVPVKIEIGYGENLLDEKYYVIPLPFLLRDTYTGSNFKDVLENIGIGNEAKMFLKFKNTRRQKYETLINGIKQNKAVKHTNKRNAETSIFSNSKHS